MMDLLGMDAYNREIIEEYSEKFEEKIRQLEMLEQESDDGTDKELAADTEKYEMWIETFCSQVPDKEIRKQIEMQIKNRYQVVVVPDSLIGAAAIFFCHV